MWSSTTTTMTTTPKGLLTKAETYRLILAARKGDQEAKAALVERNRGLIRSIVRKYLNWGVAEADLMQEGALGLLKAAKRFNTKTGNAFSTYATWWIRHSVQRAAFSHGSTIRVPLSAISKMSLLAKAKQAFYNAWGRLPSTEELSRQSGLSVRTIRHLSLSARVVRSLDEPAFVDDDDPDLHERIGVQDGPGVRELQPEVESALMSHLTSREALVIQWRHGLRKGKPATFDEIAYALALSRERIRQIYAKAIVKLQGSTALQRLYEDLPTD